MDELRKKIIKALPEILDLKFGCEVIMGSGLYTVLFYDEVEGEVSIAPKIRPKSKHCLNIKKGRLGNKIIGRPITLADVLRAVDKIGLPKHFLILPSGNIYLFETGYLGEAKANWNLKEPLSGQSKETIEFLNNLL